VFSITASSVYLTNDLLDLDADRAHPRKRTRPFAAGTLPLKWGTVLAPGLLVAGLALAALLGPLFLGLMVLYYLLTTLYSFTLKRLLIIDICTLAVLYTMRIMAGGAATGLALSVWLLAFSIFFFFALAAVKRQAELVSSTVEGADKAHGRSYLATDLPFVSMMALAAGYVSVLVLALYLNSASVSVLYSSPAALWGICVILLYWISRVCLITHRGAMNDDPVVFATKDRTSLLCAGLILALAIAGTMA
jgi:4-hydroxybenzoate polyprenyltransferase